MKLKLLSTIEDPRQVVITIVLYFCIGFLAIGLLYCAGAAAYEGMEAFMPNREREQIKLDRSKLFAESLQVRDIAQAKAQAQIEIEFAKVEAERHRLGLKPLDKKSFDRAANTFGPLRDLANVIASNILTIGMCWMMFLISRGFADHRPPWTLTLHTALICVVLGGAALVYEVTSDTKLHVEWKEVVLTLNTHSIGLLLIFFGTLLSAFSLWISSRKSND